jgi:outer membrane lipoprotein-sorting protein
MKHGKHDNSLGLRTKKNRVREATRSNASNLAVHDGKALWIFQHQLNGVINLRDEL